MNILQILPELNVGGVERGTCDLAKYLVKSGHKSIVVSNGGLLVEDLEAAGVKHYMLGVHKKSLFGILSLISKLNEIIEKENIDIVHARSRVPAWIAFFAARRTGKVFITTCHGYYKTHFASRPMAWGKLVICLSQVIAKHMVEDFGVPRERIRLISRGVDLEKFKFILPDKKAGKEFHIGMIGRLSPIKGHIYFLRAVGRLVRQLNSSVRIKAWIVGSQWGKHQAYKQELEVLAKRLGLGDIVEFLGIQQDIPAILTQLNLLVLATTTHEAFGRVIIEAQAAGVPVVATKVGGVVDIIDDNQTGLLVAPQDAEGLSQAMLEIINDNTLACRLAKAAYEKVKEKFSLQLMVRRTLEAYQEAVSHFKILVIKLSALGDVVLISASLKAIRKKFPKENYKISVLINSPYQEVLFNCPYIDELIVCDLKDKDKGLLGLWNLAKDLRIRNFDLVIDFQNNHKSHLLAALSGICQRYGYRRKFGFLLNHAVGEDKKAILGPIEHQFRILNLLGIEMSDTCLELWPSQDDERYIDGLLQRQWLSSQQVMVGVSLGTSLRWQTKIWPREYLIEVCEKLASKGLRIVFTGTDTDLTEANKIASHLKNVKPIVACGKTSINQLAALIKRCQVFISSDSAALHIACAVSTAFIALFGPTDPRRHLAPGYKGIVLSKNLSCQPCYKPRCKTRECMYAIKPQEVIEAVERLLNKH